MKIKLKKPRKAQTNFRSVERVCPNCLSTLCLDHIGNWSCSKDKLKLWEKEFLKYSALSELKKNEYLLKISDIDQFLFLYTKWEIVDETGNRPNFDCDYSSKLFRPVSTSTIIIPDPIEVKRIEKSLGRILTEEERCGEKPLWVEGNKYYKSFKKGRKKAIIQSIHYPDDLN